MIEALVERYSELPFIALWAIGSAIVLFLWLWRLGGQSSKHKQLIAQELGLAGPKIPMRSEDEILASLRLLPGYGVQETNQYLHHVALLLGGKAMTLAEIITVVNILDQPHEVQRWVHWNSRYFAHAIAVSDDDAQEIIEMINNIFPVL